jgi:hypothetical protein
MAEVRKYFDGSKVAERIDLVCKQREQLFSSSDWDYLMKKLEANRKRELKPRRNPN